MSSVPGLPEQQHSIVGQNGKADSIWFQYWSALDRYVRALSTDVAGAITRIIAGTGLTGGGSSGDVTISLADSPVAPGVYGGAGKRVSFDVNLHGIVTNASEAALSVSDVGITPAALTGANDTNVTLTFGGTPATALLKATSITVAWSGTLAAARGGFGADVSAQSGVPLFAAGVPSFVGTTGTGSFVRATSPAISGGTHTGLTGLAIRDTSAAFDVTLAATSSTALTAGRTLILDLVNVSRSVKLGGDLTFGGAFTTSGSGALTFTVTGVTSLTLPATTDVLVARTTTDTLLNKTYDTAGAGNNFFINGVAVTANTGTGAVARAASPTFTTPTINTPTISGGTASSLTGLSIRDTSAAFDVTIAATSSTALTGGCTLTLDMVNAARNVKLGGNFTIAGAVSLPAVVQGDLWYGSAAGVISALAKDTGTSRFLKNSGTSNNPAWAQPAASDLSNGTSGSGAVVLATGAALVTPSLGVATGTSFNGLTITTTTGAITITNGKTLSVSNSLTLAGTDSTTHTFPSTSSTVGRTDAAQTFTGAQTFATGIKHTLAVGSGAHEDTSSAAMLSIANGANASLGITGNILRIWVAEMTNTGDVAEFAFSGGAGNVSTMLNSIGTTWVTGTTSPSAGKCSIAHNGTAVAIYNNSGGTRSFAANVRKLA